MRRNGLNKVKKLLNNNKAFYLYKKGGSLLREPDYLNFPQKIRQKKLLEKLKREVLSRKQRRKTVDLGEQEEVPKELHSKSVNYTRSLPAHVNIKSDHDNLKVFKGQDGKLYLCVHLTMV